MLNVTQLALPEVLLLEYPIYEDNRALSHRIYSRAWLAEAGIHTEFVEEIAYHVARRNTVYGIHFQNHPKPQTKLLACTRGRMLDFAVDLRRESPTYRQWVSAELTAENRRQLYIPAGFGHMALTMADDTTIVMRIDQCFDPTLSRAVRYDDPAIAILPRAEHPILSEQDQTAPKLSDSDCNL